MARCHIGSEHMGDSLALAFFARMDTTDMKKAMTPEDARKFLDEHVVWARENWKLAPEGVAYANKLEEAVKCLHAPALPKPVIKKLDLNPEEDIDDIADFMEKFGDGRDEYHRYIGMLADMWRENYQYSEEDLRDAMELELRSHARHLVEEWREVTTISLLGYKGTDIEWVGNFSPEMLAILAEQEPCAEKSENA